MKEENLVIEWGWEVPALPSPLYLMGIRELIN